MFKIWNRNLAIFIFVISIIASMYSQEISNIIIYFGIAQILTFFFHLIHKKELVHAFKAGNIQFLLTSMVAILAYGVGLYNNPLQPFWQSSILIKIYLLLVLLFGCINHGKVKNK